MADTSDIELLRKYSQQGCGRFLGRIGATTYPPGLRDRVAPHCLTREFDVFKSD